MTNVLHDAAERGEVRPDRLTPTVLGVLHALIIKRALPDTHDLTKRDVAAMIDEVLLPLVV